MRNAEIFAQYPIRVVSHMRRKFISDYAESAGRKLGRGRYSFHYQVVVCRLPEQILLCTRVTLDPSEADARGEVLRCALLHDWWSKFLTGNECNETVGAGGGAKIPKQFPASILDLYPNAMETNW